jgi:hypothetical protein
MKCTSEQFERDVERILPYRKRHLSLSQAERDTESNIVISNCNVKIRMKAENPEYWDGVISEADNRLNTLCNADKMVNR